MKISTAKALEPTGILKFKISARCHVTTAHAAKTRMKSRMAIDFADVGAFRGKIREPLGETGEASGDIKSLLFRRNDESTNSFYGPALRSQLVKFSKNEERLCSDGISRLHIAATDNRARRPLRLIFPINRKRFPKLRTQTTPGYWSD